jgi:hypothetical protein
MSARTVPAASPRGPVTPSDARAAYARGTYIDGMTGFVAPGDVGPDVALSAARLAFSGHPVEFRGFNALGLPVYRLER